MLRLKSFADIQGIWRSGQVLSRLHEALAPMLQPGVSALELDDFARGFLEREGAKSAFLGYKGYPRQTCISFNDEVVHGIPGQQKLKAGDVVSIDLGVDLGGYISDSARTYYVGDDPPADIQRLLKGTRESLYAGIAALTARQPLANVSRAIQRVLVQHQLGIIMELTGHGVGFSLHEEPTVYNFDPGGRRPIVQDGWVIAIEPMASLGSTQIILAADNWCYRTADASRAAHFEHTVACWEGRGWILTDTQDAEARERFGGAGGG
ncbi:type I methionyl aminopeptidase [bacterium]|nr:type I methionyl aminopeptidase [bacterium]